MTNTCILNQGGRNEYGLYWAAGAIVSTHVEVMDPRYLVLRSWNGLAGGSLLNQMLSQAAIADNETTHVVNVLGQPKLSTTPRNLYRLVNLNVCHPYATWYSIFLTWSKQKG